MSSAAFVLGTDTWNAEAFGATSAAYRISARVSDSLNNYFRFVPLVRDLWSLDSKLKEILERFYEGVESPQESTTPPAAETIQSAVFGLRTLCGKIDEFYSKSKARGLTNRTLVGTALNSIRVRGEELLDIADTVDMSLHPENFEPIFDKALNEYRRGETFDLASIK